MRCEKLHDSFRRKINRRNTSFSTYPPVADVDQYLREAIEVWETVMVASAESSEFIRNALRPLEIKDLPLEFTSDYIVTLPSDYFHKLRLEVSAKKKGCEQCDKKLVARRVKSSEIDEALKDPFRISSFEYEEVLYDEFEKGLKFYVKDFEITGIKLSYYRKVNVPNCPSLTEDKFYINAEGEKVDKDTPFELDSTYVYNDITDIASFMFLRDVGDAVDADAQLKGIGVKFKMINKT